MEKEKYDELLNELLERSSGKDGQITLALMQIGRLDRIADALEEIQESLQELAGCIGPLGDFCIAGNVALSE